mmetsp:Transcript_13208/g.37172  ORF Transcript_13208/g.37172 Transcript_13208/m.37172 type:complete len:810 (+) Transcript_13208:290-2719(+)
MIISEPIAASMMNTGDLFESNHEARSSPRGRSARPKAKTKGSRPSQSRRTRENRQPATASASASESAMATTASVGSIKPEAASANVSGSQRRRLPGNKSALGSSSLHKTTSSRRLKKTTSSRGLQKSNSRKGLQNATSSRDLQNTTSRGDLLQKETNRRALHRASSTGSLRRAGRSRSSDSLDTMGSASLHRLNSNNQLQSMGVQNNTAIGIKSSRSHHRGKARRRASMGNTVAQNSDWASSRSGKNKDTAQEQRRRNRSNSFATLESAEDLSGQTTNTTPKTQRGNVSDPNIRRNRRRSVLLKSLRSPGLYGGTDPETETEPETSPDQSLSPSTSLSEVPSPHTPYGVLLDSTTRTTSYSDSIMKAKSQERETPMGYLTHYLREEVRVGDQQEIQGQRRPRIPVELPASLLKIPFDELNNTEDIAEKEEQTLPKDKKSKAGLQLLGKSVAKSVGNTRRKMAKQMTRMNLLSSSKHTNASPRHLNNVEDGGGDYCKIGDFGGEEQTEEKDHQPLLPVEKDLLATFGYDDYLKVNSDNAPIPSAVLAPPTPMTNSNSNNLSLPLPPPRGTPRCSPRLPRRPHTAPSGATSPRRSNKRKVTRRLSTTAVVTAASIFALDGEEEEKPPSLEPPLEKPIAEHRKEKPVVEQGGRGVVSETSRSPKQRLAEQQPGEVSLSAPGKIQRASSGDVVNFAPPLPLASSDDEDGEEIVAANNATKSGARGSSSATDRNGRGQRSGISSSSDHNRNHKHNRTTTGRTPTRLDPSGTQHKNENSKRKKHPRRSSMPLVSTVAAPSRRSSTTTRRMSNPKY